MLRWLNQLSDSDQERQAQARREMRWSRTLDQLADLDIGQSAATAWHGFTQRVESGELDEEVRAASAKTVESVLKSVVSLCEAVTGTRARGRRQAARKIRLWNWSSSIKTCSPI